eukprot:Opistho-2@16338
MFSAFARRAVQSVGPQSRRLASSHAEVVAPKIEPVVLPMPTAKANLSGYVVNHLPKINENVYLGVGAASFVISLFIASGMGVFTHFRLVNKGYAQSSVPVPRTA